MRSFDLVSIHQSRTNISNIQKLTGCTEAIAKSLLEKFNNNVDAAVGEYFDNQSLYESKSGKKAAPAKASAATAAKIKAMFDKYADHEEPDTIQGVCSCRWVEWTSWEMVDSCVGRRLEVLHLGVDSGHGIVTGAVLDAT